jgi:hypothetical protein
MAARLAAISMVPMLALTACEKRLTPANIDAANRFQESASKRTGRAAQVEEGLSHKEVESILGQPARVEMEKRPILVQKNLEVTRWYYEQDGKTIELLFVDGNLQRKIPQFEAPPESPVAPPIVVTPGTIETTSLRPLKK